MVLGRLPTHGYDLPTASRAVRALLRNPDDLPQVFLIIEALSGNTLPRLRRRLQRSMLGNTLLQDQPDIVQLLGDHERLARMPEGSLAHAYLRFVQSEGISAEGILEASEVAPQRRDLDDEERYVFARLRDTHDLWHTVTGYQGDVLGELALLGFTVAQTANPGIAVILLAGLMKGFARGQSAVVLEGVRRGRRACWLLETPWESLLPRPIDEVRQLLGVDAPPRYQPVRSTLLREQGRIAA